jgi:hypothetical protein
MLPRITRMTTGLLPKDPLFRAEWEYLMHQSGGRLASGEGKETTP